MLGLISQLGSISLKTKLILGVAAFAVLAYAGIVGVTYRYLETTQEKLVAAAAAQAKSQIVIDYQAKDSELKRQQAVLEIHAMETLQQIQQTSEAELEAQGARVDALPSPIESAAEAPTQPLVASLPANKDTSNAAQATVDGLNRLGDDFDRMLESASAGH